MSQPPHFVRATNGPGIELADRAITTVAGDRKNEKRPSSYSDSHHDAEGQDVQVVDAVFGEMSGEGPKYRAVGTLGAFVLITKTNLGLGVLSIPFVFMVLGIVPGIIVILIVQTLIAYCAYMIGPFKTNHPEVYGLADAAYVFGGRIAKEYWYIVFAVNLLMIVSAAIVSISVALNAISTHGACTAVFVAVAAIVGGILGSIRTLHRISWIGWAGLVSLVASVLTLTVAVGVQSRPAAAPPTGPWEKNIMVVGKPTFAAAIGAVNNVFFSYGATPTYFNIVSEMRDPRTYGRAMTASIAVMTIIYLVIGNVVYHYVGQYVASPALGSAGPLMKKVCYGLSLPALVASLTIVTHIGSKHVFVRLLAGSRHLASNSPTHWMTWIGCILGSVVISYVVASAIPNFNSIIGLIGALIVPSAAIIPYPLMWWHDNWRYATAEERSRRAVTMAINVAIVVIGVFMTGAGTYAAVLDIINSSGSAGPWSCGDNSNSVKE